MHQYPTFTPISNLSRNDVFGNNHLHGLLQSSNQKRYICDIVNTSKMHQYPPFTSISYRRANHCFQNVPRCHCSRLFGFEPRRRPPMTTIGHGTSLFSFGWFSNVSTRILQTKYKIRCTCTSETHILQIHIYPSASRFFNFT